MDSKEQLYFTFYFGYYRKDWHKESIYKDRPEMGINRRCRNNNIKKGIYK